MANDTATPTDDDLMTEALDAWRSRLLARAPLDPDQQDMVAHLDHLGTCIRTGSVPREPGMANIPSNRWITTRAACMLANEVETGDPMTSVRHARIAGLHGQVRELSRREQDVVERLRGMSEAEPRQERQD